MLMGYLINTYIDTLIYLFNVVAEISLVRFLLEHLPIFPINLPVLLDYTAIAHGYPKVLAAVQGLLGQWVMQIARM